MFNVFIKPTKPLKDTTEPIKRQWAKTVLSILWELALYGHTQAVKETPASDGILQGSIIVSTPDDVNKVLNAFGKRVSFTGEYYSTKEYVEAIEYGRELGAKMPPWKEGSSLYRWVEKNASEIGIEPGANLESVSFLIARKIADWGFRDPYTDGWRMFQKSAKKVEKASPKIVDRELKKFVRKVS